MRLLVVNAGSSSLKLRVLDGAELVASYDAVPDELPDVDAVGHRIVHGGTEFRTAALLDDDVIARLTALTELAPLHQPKSLRALDQVRTRLPDLPHVACFDTAFHATMPAAAATYAVPREWRERYAVRRYGFHGLSHAYATRRAAELLDRPVEELRLVTCHLGAGASLAAVRHGRSVDTTMGFTPLEGLVMATRSGTVDPGLVLWLEEHEGLSPHEVAQALEQRSGLLALAGTGDMRELLARDDAEARLAVEVYVHRLRAAVAAMTASAGGLDALVFTGGVGENAPEIRTRAASGLAFLGILVDERLNTGCSGDADVSSAETPVRTLVVRSREDLEIARQVAGLLGELT